jgi:hypothetical protein
MMERMSQPEDLDAHKWRAVTKCLYKWKSRVLQTENQDPIKVLKAETTQKFIREASLTRTPFASPIDPLAFEPKRVLPSPRQPTRLFDIKSNRFIDFIPGVDALPKEPPTKISTENVDLAHSRLPVFENPSSIPSTTTRPEFASAPKSETSLGTLQMILNRLPDFQEPKSPIEAQADLSLEMMEAKLIKLHDSKKKYTENSRMIKQLQQEITELILKGSCAEELNAKSNQLDSLQEQISNYEANLPDFKKETLNLSLKIKEMMQKF